MGIFWAALQGFLVAAFVMSGGLKLLPSDTMAKRNYDKMRLPMWWLAPIGVIELVTGVCLAAGLFFPGWTALGALIGVATMAGAVLAHLVQDKAYDGYSALVLLVVSSVVLWAHGGELTALAVRL